jgi:uncharacterized protein YraI
MTERGPLSVAAALLLALALVAPAAADSVRVGAEHEVVSDEGVNLRTAPGTDSAVLALVKPGEGVVVRDGPTTRNGIDWYEIERDGDVGWISGEFLVGARARTASRGDVARPADDRPRSSAPPGVRVGSEASVVSRDGLNLRVAPALDAPVMEVIRDARFVFVIDGPEDGELGPWFRVEFDGAFGWVLGTHLGAANRSAVVSRATGRGFLPPPPLAVRPPPDSAALGQAIADRARQYLGAPYVWGGTTPSGFDCSGLILHVMGQFGIWPGRTADDQAGAGISIKSQDLLPGDIVVYANTYGPGYAHTGIYIGDGYFVHAEDYDTGVVISSAFSGYWGRHYAGARRAW